MVIQSNNHQPPSQHYGAHLLNMPEPPPPYSAATAPPLPQYHPGTSSMEALGQNGAEEEEKFAASTPFHQQQQQTMPAAQHQHQPSSLAGPAQSSLPPSHHPYILPPGSVPQQPPLASPLGHHFQPGFVPSGPILIAQPPITITTTATNNGTIQTPMNGHQHSQGGQVKVIYAVPLGPHGTQLECSNCRQPVRTRVLRRPGLLAWLICGALALVGCWPCCVLPFCVQSCQDAEHYCPNCNNFIGKYARI